MKRSLLLIAHGSRRVASNVEVRQIANTLRERTRAEFIYVDAAFLELAKPSIPEGIDMCIQAGAEEVMVLPYFLSAGRHVAKDIPDIVAAKQALHPNVNLIITPYLGVAANLTDVLLSLLPRNTVSALN